MGDAFDSTSLGMRTQKKLLSKMSSKRIAKMFIDETAGRILDNLYKITKDYSGSKKQAEKIIKNLIKIVIKIGILYRNEQFTQEELRKASAFKQKFRAIGMTVISFHEVDFSFDKNFLAQSFKECSDTMKDLVRPHLTEKSLGRIDLVFGFYGNPDFLEAVFRKDGQFTEKLHLMVADLNKMMEDGSL